MRTEAHILARRQSRRASLINNTCALCKRSAGTPGCPRTELKWSWIGSLEQSHQTGLETPHRHFFCLFPPASDSAPPPTPNGRLLGLTMNHTSRRYCIWLECVHTHTQSQALSDHFHQLSPEMGREFSSGAANQPYVNIGRKEARVRG